MASGGGGQTIRTARHAGAAGRLLQDFDTELGTPARLSKSRPPTPYHDGALAQLGEFYVQPGLRGQGIGAALLETAILRVRERGAAEVHITVDEAGVDARRFHGSHGFTNARPGKDCRMLCCLRGPDHTRRKALFRERRSTWPEAVFCGTFKLDGLQDPRYSPIHGRPVVREPELAAGAIRTCHSPGKPLGYSVCMVRGLADVGAEGVLLAGAGRAVLLQIAHPAIGHAIAEHSNFSERPMDRLRSTMSYVYAVVYGTSGQVAAVRRAVNRAHARVRRQPDAASRGYNAFDAETQLWVVATLYDTMVTVHEKIHGPLDDASADAVYREYARIGTALQLPEQMWPADRAAFRDYWNHTLAGLEADEVAVRVARDLLYPPAGPVGMRLVMPLVRLITAGLLPRRLRQDFRLPWNQRHRLCFEHTINLLARIYPLLPQRVRHWPKNYYLGQVAPALGHT